MRAGSHEQNQHLTVSNRHKSAFEFPRGLRLDVANLFGVSDANYRRISAEPVVLEARISRALNRRGRNWPVGPEKLRGAGWYAPCRTVQLIRRRPGESGPRFTIWTFFSQRRVDLRYPPFGCDHIVVAQRMAMRRLEQVAGERVLVSRRSGIDLARAGDVLGLDDLA